MRSSCYPQRLRHVFIAHPCFIVVLVLAFGTICVFVANNRTVSNFSSIIPKSNETNTVSQAACFSSVSQHSLSSAIVPIDLQRTSIFHLHIQKAGGTALATVLSSALCNCPDDTTRRYVPRECNCPKTPLLPKISNANAYPGGLPVLQSRLTTGWRCGVHPSLAQIKECPHHLNLTVGGAHDNIAIVTSLRDPLQRVLSEYRWCEMRECWDWSNLDGRYTLSQYAQLNNQNRQMKMLSGCPHDTNWMNETVCRTCLQAAKENVAKFAFVTLEEESAFFLESALGALLLIDASQKNLTLPTVNVHQHEPQANHTPISERNISDSTISAIVKNNRYDYEL